MSRRSSDVDRRAALVNSCTGYVLNLRGSAILFSHQRCEQNREGIESPCVFSIRDVIRQTFDETGFVTDKR
jgi:hypothetical protein